MKRYALIAAALGALVATSAAIAHGWRTADVTAVSATLTATTPTNVQTSTFTCDGQTIEVTTGRWSGTATSSTPDLAGAAELQLKSVFNATKNLGWVDGKLKIRAADGKTVAQVSGINSGGTLDAWLRGHAGKGDGALLGSLTGTFSKTAGLTAGAIGSGAGADAAVLADGVRCEKPATTKPSVHLFVRGTVEAVSPTSLSVKPADGTATQTCAVTDAREVERVKAGDRVQMKCAQVNGAWVLLDVDRKR
ncbi:MAG: hypothetical protein ACRDNB_08160 [Gaiellaceae bacterium]